MKRKAQVNEAITVNTKQQFKPSVNEYRSAKHITVLTPTTYQTRSLQVTLLI